MFYGYLASMAADWADGCQWKHGQPARDADTMPFNPIGQNLYLTSSNTIDLSGAIQAWYDEISDYDYDTRACSGAMCGHYTQVRQVTFVCCHYTQVRQVTFVCGHYTQVRQVTFVCGHYTQVRQVTFVCGHYTQVRQVTFVCGHYTQVRQVTFMCGLYTQVRQVTFVCGHYTQVRQVTCVCGHYTQVRQVTFACGHYTQVRQVTFMCGHYTQVRQVTVLFSKGDAAPAPRRVLLHASRHRPPRHIDSSHSDRETIAGMLTVCCVCMPRPTFSVLVLW